MTNFNAGDIVLINFPFTTLTSLKQRPAIIISSKWYNEKKPDVILAAITSQLPQKIEDDEYLLSHEEQVLAGLPKKSVIKLWKIITIDKRLIRKKLGHLPQETLLHLRNILIKIHI